VARSRVLVLVPRGSLLAQILGVESRGGRSLTKPYELVVFSLLT
jgi:hypothetical protein